jgi:hypothetical protein
MSRNLRTLVSPEIDGNVRSTTEAKDSAGREPFLGAGSSAMSCGFATSISTPPTHAPQHSSCTDTWGVSDPATAPGRRLRFAGGVAHAPSLLRQLCWGALRAAQTAARLNSSADAKIAASNELQGSRTATFRVGGRGGLESCDREGGQPRLGLASPSSAPFVGVRTVMWTTMVESQLSP